MTTFDLEGLSAFQLAITESAIQCLVQCLRYLPQEILDQSDALLRTPLLLAVATGNQDIIQVRNNKHSDYNNSLTYFPAFS